MKIPCDGLSQSVIDRDILPFLNFILDSDA